MNAERLGRLFVQEAEVRLRELGRLLLRLEQSADDDELVRSVYRELHTLKGSAAVVGLDEISQSAHHLEELVEEVRSGQKSATPEVIDTLLRGVDELAAAVAQVGVAAPPAGPVQAEPSRTNGASPYRTSSAEPAPVTVAGSSNGAASGVIMVPVERLEELTRLIGETASAHLRIGRLLKDRFDVDPGSVTEFNELSRSINDLHDRAMRTQMVPVATITDQLQRAVRDLARAQGKDVRWETAGTDTELDRGVLQQLTDSVMHLVRNAVDHGIEPEEERVRAGKPARATIRLHAMPIGSDVAIAVTDDGRGIDASRVEREANRLGVETEGLTNEELLALAFQPGLSTASFVSDVSGRGVGLDVVRTNVESAHGRVEVRSTPGAGTEFRIIVPITVAVLRCLLVEASGQALALPFHRVILTQPHDPARLAYAEGRPVVWVNAHPLPLHTLSGTLGLPGNEAQSGPVVVLADAARRHAFVIDRLIGQRDVVVKPLSALLPHLPAVSGASLEADGSILLVLDPPGLIERALRSGRAPRPVSAAAADPNRRRVLVVDDALIVRELQRGILERAGYDVRVASDGQQALSHLANERSDLVVTDIEMPTMDGFELTEAIRAHPTLANIPVLIVSSRASDADRQRGLDAGADGYITKSAFDESSLLSAVDRLLGTSAP